MSKLIKQFLLSVTTATTLFLTGPAMSQTQSTPSPAVQAASAITFKLTGGYQFADTFNVIASDPIVYAQAGRLTGAFQWKFADGREARTHINGATANRVTAQGAEIFGTMKINMFEAEGKAPESELLYLAYEGTIAAQGSKVTVQVRGRFIGGTGQYAGATGTVELSSINGFFDNGIGTLNLKK
jgi:hypothetical protein